ncbi:hypothetical protein [Nocardioides jishulii]|uniref:Uncharacterized protein n=1 Tax=Nocardioides jishulii TaxID=2575440 RepID=A0A4V6X643_9ACTN|nr:hypothetical protein [Nocardioides jishulii]QCX28374.1 hypothetical protein FCL41_13225 [Nocardioides jishulii]TKI64733.1 hypothetical protein FC770_06350 [Nocardioides jishulii]
MTATGPDSASVAPAAPSGRRRLALLSWASPGAVVVAVVVWNTGAYLIDASSLGQGIDSWGVSFVTAIYSAFVGVPILLLALLTAGVATSAPNAARRAVMAGAGVSAVTGFVMAVLALGVTFSDPAEGEVAFAVLTLVVAVVLLAPAWAAWDALAER